MCQGVLESVFWRARWNGRYHCLPEVEKGIEPLKITRCNPNRNVWFRDFFLIYYYFDDSGSKWCGIIYVVVGIF